MRIGNHRTSLGERLDARRTARHQFSSGGLFPVRHVPYASTPIDGRSTSTGERDVPDASRALRPRLVWTSAAAGAAVMFFVAVFAVTLF